MDESSEQAPDHIEIAQLEGLIAAAGKDVTQEIVEAFWRSTEGLLTALAAELQSGAHDRAAKTAHAIKGSASNIGAARLSHTAARMETACRSNDGDSATRLLEAAHADFDAVRDEISNFMKRSA